MKEYVTAAKRHDSNTDSKRIEFKVDDRECVAFMPEPGQIAMLIAALGNHETEWNQVAGIINFLMAVLDKDTHTYLAGRLLDRKDPFDLPQVREIVEDMIEEWAARPTESPSDSTGQQQSGGSTSTPPTPALT